MAKKISRAIDRKGIRTLVVDIGGSGIKVLVLDGAGRPLTVRDRKKTPSLATPSAILKVIQFLARRQGRFDRVADGISRCDPPRND
jgi:polyphosphate glucokinase